VNIQRIGRSVIGIASGPSWVTSREAVRRICSRFRERQNSTCLGTGAWSSDGTPYRIGLTIRSRHIGSSIWEWTEGIYHSDLVDHIMRSWSTIDADCDLQMFNLDVFHAFHYRLDRELVGHIEDLTTLRRVRDQSRRDDKCYWPFLLFCPRNLLAHRDFALVNHSGTFRRNRLPTLRYWRANSHHLD